MIVQVDSNTLIRSQRYINNLKEQKEQLIEALEEVSEQLELSLQRLGCCGNGDGKDRKADVDDFGGYESLATARQAIAKARGK